MKTPKVSILVPIYNVEKYLPQCLNSIIAQSLADIEIICINDGSSDGSHNILQDFATRDQRIQIINKPNGGYGQSMNIGLDAARGEYIGIVESDDYVDAEMFELLYVAASANAVQVAKSDFYLTWTKPSLHEQYHSAIAPKDANRVINPSQNYKIIQSQPAIWSAIYQRSFLIENNIRFLETPGASFQDTSFNYKVWTAADRAYLINKALLHYRQDNANSSINATTKIDAVVKEFDEYFDFLSRYPQKQQSMQRIMQGIVYKTYRWNVTRIDQSFRADFVAYMHSYFTQQQAAGHITPEYFELDFYKELELLLNNPAKYLKLVNSKLNTWLLQHGHAFHLRNMALPCSIKDGAAMLVRKLTGN